MSERIHALAQRLLGKPTIEECNLQEVKDLVQRFPYFAPAQFLLLEKLKQEGSEAYPAQLQRSILYYHDPLSFQYFIDSDRFYTEVSFEGKNEPQVINYEQDEDDSEISTISSDVATTDDKQEIVEEQLPTTDSYKEIAVEEDPAINLPEETNKLQVLNNEPQVMSNEPALIAEDTQKEIAGKIQTEEHLATPAENSEPDAQNPKPKTQNSELSASFTFEPYHTVDYFASQGIKLSQEEIPKDKFGKQLKSFTEWLKTMKRIAPAQMSQGIDAGTENKVQHLANDSVHDSSVFTEAMAEVWIKQGNDQKALKIYEQLSLLNPSKKAYFATKIENLKRS